MLELGILEKLIPELQQKIAEAATTLETLNSLTNDLSAAGLAGAGRADCRKRRGHD